MKFIILFVCAIFTYVAYSFGKYIIERQLTQDWNAANWAIFRSYKDAIGNPRLTVAEYVNIKTKQQDEKIDQLLYQVSSKGPAEVYGRNNIYKLSDYH